MKMKPIIKQISREIFISIKTHFSFKVTKTQLKIAQAKKIMGIVDSGGVGSNIPKSKNSKLSDLSPSQLCFFEVW